MDLTPSFRSKLEEVYAEKYRLFIAWTSTDAPRPGILLSRRIVPENLPVKNMLLWQYRIHADERSRSEEEKSEVTLVIPTPVIHTPVIITPVIPTPVIPTPVTPTPVTPTPVTPTPVIPAPVKPNSALERPNEKEEFNGADQVLRVKDKPQKKTRGLQRFIGLFTVCFRGL